MPVHFPAWQEILSGEGYRLQREVFAAAFGKRNDNTLSLWLGPDLPAAELVRLSDTKEDYYRQLLTTYSILKEKICLPTPNPSPDQNTRGPSSNAPSGFA